MMVMIEVIMAEVVEGVVEMIDGGRDDDVMEEGVILVVLMAEVMEVVMLVVMAEIVKVMQWGRWWWR